MASKYDWDFIRPLDQTANIAAMSQGNQQINAGLQGIAGAVTGFADARKQQNTDSILNALMGAQTTADLPNAMNAVQALQQQYGRGYDQTAVRNAIDSRGSTLGARDLQNINLQQAQAAQAAIPQLNQAAYQEAIRQGANPNTIQGLAGLGIDASSQIGRFGTNAQGDARYQAEGAERKANRTEDVAWRQQQAAQQQNNWQQDFNFRGDESDWKRAGDVSAENPKSQGWSTDAAGNPITVTNGGVSRVDAYGALAGVRGIRNNNPGNINFSNQPGASLESKGGRFARFSTPEQGINAMSKQLDLYFTGKSQNVTKPINTIQDIITTWAPPKNKKGQVENNTPAYIASVAKAMGVSSTAKLNLNDPNTKAALMSAMISHENGGNPYTANQYIAGITGRQGNSGPAPQGGGVVPKSAIDKITSTHGDSLAKLNAEFSVQTAKDKTKGSLATTGKNIDTWAASKKDSGLLFSNNNSYFTKASDLAKMAKKDPTFSKLPEGAQINVLEGAYAVMSDVNAFQYVPDSDLKKFISTQSANYEKTRVSQFESQKANLREQTYQDTVQAYQAAGVKPPSRDGVMQMIDPQYKSVSATKPSTQAKVASKEPSKPAVAIPYKAPASKQETQMDKHLREREARKKAEWAVVEKRLAKEKADKQVSKKSEESQYKKMVIPSSSSGVSQKELDEIMKKFKSR